MQEFSVTTKTYEEIMAMIDAVDVVAYERTRNHLSGSVSRLSPYITRGIVTLPAIRDRIMQRSSRAAARKFIQELAWREYFQRVWWQQGEGIFSDLRPGVRRWQHQALPTGIRTGTTGIVVVDEAIAQLYRTGYVHNHARMWIAGLATNVAHAHWLPVSRWFYYHLIDGDIASNTLSFQWVAGTLTGKPYDFNQSIINACSPVTQTDTFLDIQREQLLEIVTPPSLQATEPLTLPVTLPQADPISDLGGQTVRLFHPFHLDPTWRADTKSCDVLLIDPDHFTQFPVSPLVMNYIVTQARTVLPNLLVHVGAATTLPGFERATVHSRAHPTISDLPITFDPVPLLFPEVQGSFRSFSAFWRACEPYIG
jgi:deoxyribodipyrimidine photo-lyase